MSNLIPHQASSPSLLSSDARRGGRTISRMSAGALVRMTGIDLETDVTLAKTGSATAITGSMMGDVVRVAQAQRHLELLAPEAAGRLAMLADTHVLGLVEIEADHRRGLRRI